MTRNSKDAPGSYAVTLKSTERSPEGIRAVIVPVVPTANGPGEVTVWMSTFAASMQVS